MTDVNLYIYIYKCKEIEQILYYKDIYIRINILSKNYKKRNKIL